MGLPQSIDIDLSPDLLTMQNGDRLFVLRDGALTPLDITFERLTEQIAAILLPLLPTNPTVPPTPSAYSYAAIFAVV